MLLVSRVAGYARRIRINLLLPGIGARELALANDLMNNCEITVYRSLRDCSCIYPPGGKRSKAKSSKWYYCNSGLKCKIIVSILFNIIILSHMFYCINFVREDLETFPASHPFVKIACGFEKIVC